MFRDIKRTIRFFLQKLFWGFSEKDIWSLDSTISKFILPRLKYFRNHRFSWPERLESKEEWTNILDKMIKAFEFRISEEYLSTTDKKKFDELNEGLDLFCKYFLDLWD